MATNNDVNNNFPSGLTASGTVNINTTGSGATTIGSSSSGAVNIASNSACTVTLNNQNYTVTTGTGSINIGTDATAKIITIGNASLGDVVFTNAGWTLDLSGTNMITANGTGNLVITNPGGGDIDLTASQTRMGFTNFNIANVATLAGNVPIVFGNTNGTTSVTINSGTGPINIGTSVAKTINIGNTTGASGISFSVSGTGSGSTISFPFLNVSSSSANLIPGLMHVVTNSSGLTTLTLPTTCPLGNKIMVGGYGSGGWSIAQNSGQTIFSTAASTTTGVGGSLASGGRYDCVTITCITANTSWSVASSYGTLTFT